LPDALQPVTELATVASGGLHHWLSNVQPGLVGEVFRRDRIEPLIFGRG
jgi:hypothetical protein